MDIEYEHLKLKDFNLRIGYPTIVNIDAGKEEFKYIEVKDPLSLIYIGFATQNYDINFRLYKYKDSDTKSENGHKGGFFKEILNVEKLEANDTPVKFILLAPEPCFYKVVWDNSYSWLNNKKLRIRLSILRPTEILDSNNFASFIDESKLPISIITTDNQGRQHESIPLQDLKKVKKPPIFSYIDESGKQTYRVNNFSNYCTNEITGSILYVNVFGIIEQNRAKIFYLSKENTDLILLNDFVISSKEFEDNLLKSVSESINHFSEGVSEQFSKIVLHSILLNTDYNEVSDNSVQNRDFIRSLGYYPEAMIKDLEERMHVQFRYKKLSEGLLEYALYKRYLKLKENTNERILMICLDSNNNINTSLHVDESITSNSIKSEISEFDAEVQKQSILKVINECQTNVGSIVVILASTSFDDKILDDLFNELETEVNVPSSIEKLGRKDWLEMFGLIPNFH